MIRRDMLRFRLREFLEEHQLSAYRLGLNVPELDAQTIYHYVRGSRTPSFKGLDAVIRGLRILTGKPVQVTDLLEYISEEEFNEADERERQSWTIISLNNNHDNKTTEIGKTSRTLDLSLDIARDAARVGASRFRTFRRHLKKRLRKRLYRFRRRFNAFNVRMLRGVGRR